MTLHPELDDFGAALGRESMALSRPRELAAYLASGDHNDARLLECRRHQNGKETVVFEVRAERPQDLQADIRRWEPIAARFATADDSPPSLFAMREDFPETPHQNAVLTGQPRSPCVDDRPWAEARLSWTPLSFLERVRWWLGAAASGALSGNAQAVDPLFIRCGADVVIPRTLLGAESPGGALLLSGTGLENTQLFHLRAGPGAHGPGFLMVVPIKLCPQPTRALRWTPNNLGELVIALNELGFDLLSHIRKSILEAASVGGWNPKLALLIVAPIARRAGLPAAIEDAQMFGIPMSLGDLGVRTGVLDRNPDYNPSSPKAGCPYGRRLPMAPPDRLDEVDVLPMPVHVDFDRELARQCAGLPIADSQQVVLVGAGAMGSHLAMALAREGRFRWTIVDNDWLLPHNLGRHTLDRRHLGTAKAEALAGEISILLGESGAARGLVADVLFPGEKASELEAAFREARGVIDASASVAVARQLSDTDGQQRLASVFLNPAGTASVLLCEDAVRGIRLDDLEGQYYRLLLTNPCLQGHLAAPTSELRYTGACRQISSRIPETNVVTLTGLASRGLAAAFEGAGAVVHIWSMASDGTVDLAKAKAMPTHRVSLDEWTVTFDDGLLGIMKAAREASLSAETGGVLVGVTDVWRKRIVVVHALEPPPDSVGTEDGFERGVAGLTERLRHVQTVTRDQVRYVGEWHSHPRGHSGFPSRTDIAQVLALRAELGRENIPPIMMILGESGEVIVTAWASADEPDADSSGNDHE